MVAYYLPPTRLGLLRIAYQTARAIHTATTPTATATGIRLGFTLKLIDVTHGVITEQFQGTGWYTLQLGGLTTDPVYLLGIGSHLVIYSFHTIDSTIMVNT
jgi:hypothetical protein